MSISHIYNKRFTFFLVLLTFISNHLLSQGSLLFVENKGQWRHDFKYYAMGAASQFYINDIGYTVVVGHEDNNTIISKRKEGQLTGEQTLKFHAYKMNWVNALKPLKMIGDKYESYYFNYYLDNDPTRWKSGIHPSRAIEIQRIYEGIDVRISSINQNPKFDYIIKPNGKVEDLQFQYEGIEKLEIKDNKLHLYTSLGVIQELEPYSFQYINGEKVEIQINYILLGENKVGFKPVDKYNKNFDLIIDPEVVFASLTGSIPDNWGFAATYDAAGNLFGGGIVNGASYPTSTGAFQVTFGGGTAGTSMPCDIGITKFSSDGTSLLYSTYIGGNGNDYPHSMIVDNSGNLYISGKTNSTNFPTTSGAFDESHNGMFDIFVLKLNADGTDLLASTYFGGSGNDGLNVDADFSGATSTLKFNYGDNARSEILIDNLSNVYVAAATQSTNFPITSTAVKTTLTGTQDGVLFKLNTNLNTLIWSTYLGGSDDDAAYVIAFDNGYNNIFVAGGTQSTDFMSTYMSGLMSSYQGGVADGFICKFQNSGTYSLINGTFLGTTLYDQIFGIQVDGDNDVYVMGQTLGDFPVTAGVYSNPGSRQFLMKLNNLLSTNIYSTVWGQGATAMPNIVPVAFLVDTCKHVYISGWGGTIAGGTMSSLPITDDALQPTTDGNDFYFIVFKEDAAELLYATYFGAAGKSEHVDGGTSRFNPNGEVYQAICASCGPGSSGFPATPGAWASTKGSTSTNCNLGVVKIAFNLGNVNADAIPLPSNEGCPPFEVTFDNLSSNASDYIWDFGDGSATTTVEEPTHTFTEPGTYNVRLIAMNENGCIERDTTYIAITVSDKVINPDFEFNIIDSCIDFSVQFTNTSTSYDSDPLTSATYTWIFGDGTTFSGPSPLIKFYPEAGSYSVTLIMHDENACSTPDSITKIITFNPILVTANFPGGNICADGSTVTFENYSVNGTSYIWDFGDGGSNSSDFSPTYSYSESGTYTVTLIAMNDATCNKADTITQVITVYPKPKADFYYLPIVPETNKPTAFTNTSIGGISYSWDFGDGSTSNEINPIKQYAKTGSYKVCLSVTNQYDCVDSICKTVQSVVEPLLDIPTAFTPNGDGSNDVLFPRGFAIKEMKLQIYNRWGELVFESTSMSNGWDGTYKGVDQPMDSYAYILTATFLDGTNYQKQGNVTLIR